MKFEEQRPTQREIYLDHKQEVRILSFVSCCDVCEHIVGVGQGVIISQWVPKEVQMKHVIKCKPCLEREDHV